MSRQVIAFIGGGNMAASLVGGWPPEGGRHRTSASREPRPSGARS